MRVGDLVRHIYHDTFLPELSCGVVVDYEKEVDLYKVFWYSIKTLENFYVADDGDAMLEIVCDSR